ncbi:hypothetical protein E2320_018091, partial [Naja naja]
ELGRAIPSAPQSPPQRGDPDPLDSKTPGKPEEKEVPNASKTDGRLWLKESSCLGEDTDRGGEPSCAHHGNIEMKGGAEESFSESEGSIENIEGLS